MAKRKIVWSRKAKIKLNEILKFYANRNKNKIYSEKLYLLINKELRLLMKHPEIGVKTEIESIRGLIIGNYILFYELTADKVIILTLWDSNQNPEDLIIK